MATALISVISVPEPIVCKNSLPHDTQAISFVGRLADLYTTEGKARKEREEEGREGYTGRKDAGKQGKGRGER